MAGELAVRFLLGGALVSIFAVCGEVFRPKTFGGLFGAAPSVALVALIIGLARQGEAFATQEARSMALGAVAMVLYCAVCVRLTQRRSPKLWLDTVLAWAAWLVPALGLWWGTTGGAW
jgi:uncharacterized membrane protein (GlpM family)